MIHSKNYTGQLLLAVLFFSNFGLNAQQNAKEVDKLNIHYQSQALFDDALYGLSTFSAKYHNDLSHPLHLSDLDIYHVENDITSALSKLRLNAEGAENTLKTAIVTYHPDPNLYPILTALASTYYNQKQYGQALELYEQIDIESLPTYDMSEAAFKKGYAYFVTKEFAKAKESFAISRDIKNEFYYPTNYYYGISDYFLNNYNDAITSFQKVKSSDVYRSFIPYYLVQIHFAQNQPEKVISNGEVALKDPELRNRKEIQQLVGQAYFQRKEYELALPHLQYYEENTDKLTIDEFYQLSFTQYQLKKYKDAVENFRELSLLDSKLGQVVNYYMADCYYRLGDLISARAAFKKVGQMSYNTAMQEEAIFNYGKLSAEAGFEREAINTLLKLDKKSPHYAQGRDIINDILENTSDYAGAMQAIENMTDLNDKLKSTYQQVSYKRGLVLYNQGEYADAEKAFAKVKTYKSHKPSLAQAQFWTAMIQNMNKDYKASNATLADYFKTSNGVNTLDPAASPSMAYYMQGYNYLYSNNHKDALQSFKTAISGFYSDKEDKKTATNHDIVYSDAIVRYADCSFKANDYKTALDYYKKGVFLKQSNQVYAQYQQAIIEGLMDEPYEKIVTLKDLVNKYPSSAYADDAYLQLGETYLENDNIDNAYASFNQLKEKYPNSELRNAATIKLGLIAYNKADNTTAIAHYKSILSNNPSQKELEGALLGLREIYIKDLGTPDEYIALVANIPGHEISAQTADSLAYSVGEAKYEEGDYEKAIAGYNNYLAKYPNGFNKIAATYFSAESHSLLKRYSQALPLYEFVANLGQSEFYVPSVKKSAIISYNHTQQFDKAVKYYDLYHTLATDESEKHLASLGAMRSASRSNKSDITEKHANLIIANTTATNDDKASAHYFLAKIYQKASQWDKAKTNYKKVETLSSNHLAAEARYQVAEIAFAQSKYNDAEKLVEDANEKNNAHPEWIARGLLLLSDIYIQKSDLLNARAACEAVIENFQDDKEISKLAQAKLAKIAQLEASKSRIKPTTKNTLDFNNN